MVKVIVRHALWSYGVLVPAAGVVVALIEHAQDAGRLATFLLVWFVVALVCAWRDIVDQHAA